MIYTKCNLSNIQGKNFNESHYTIIIDSDQDGYYRDSSGNTKVLFKFKKGVITRDLSDLAINTFLKFSKLRHSGRGIAAGILPGQKNARTINPNSGQNEGQYVASNISGYYDRPLREHRGQLKTIVACRTTAFTLKNKHLWTSGLPFIEKCSKLYRKYSPREWKIQNEEYSLINNKLKIPKTVFTTITSNYNWRTACHCDSGDFAGGLGNLIVVGKDFTGGYLGFPEYRVIIKIKPGDFLLMDSHQMHCNTKINLLKPDGFRLSFVMYIRTDMSKCTLKRVIGDTSYLI
jgi:hypothetical protein